MPKVIYLASHTAVLEHDNVVYQDLIIERDLGGCMLTIDLVDYDILIATPPCNWYSRAIGNRQPSDYAVNTKHLLPSIIKKFENLDKPFIVENVINKVKMKDIINNLNCFYYEFGRHSYFTNVMIDFRHLEQVADNIKYSNDRQGGINVNIVLDYFIKYVSSDIDER